MNLSQSAPRPRGRGDTRRSIPASAGRMKRRNVAYLGLLPPPKDGMSDITGIYIAKYGAARLGTKIFIVTCQQKNGWKGTDKETNEIVPGITAVQQAAAEASLGAGQGGLAVGAPLDDEVEGGQHHEGEQGC